MLRKVTPEHQGMLHIVILYFEVYSLGYDGSLLNGLQALPAWQRDLVSTDPIPSNSLG
jgi:hypothetical protein